MANKNHTYQLSLFFVLITLLILVFTTSIIAADNQTDDALSNYVREIRYQDYLQKHQEAERPDEEILIPAESFSEASDGVEVLRNYEGEDTAVSTGERDYLEWVVDVEKAGLYNIEIKYFPLEGRGSDIERDLQINGERPFAGARYLTFKRVWGDKGVIQKDTLGNEIRPQQIQKPMWIEKSLRDSMGYIDDPYLFYLKAGRNTIRLTSRSEPMAIAYLKLYQKKELPEYYQVKKKEENKEKTEGVFIKLQERDAEYRSDSSIFPIYDKGDPTVEPYDPAAIRLNAIGGYRWAQVGQWISWDFEAPEDGLYKIALKAKQEVTRGTYSNRKIYIDGKVPFKELKAVSFPYSSEYKMRVLGSKEDPYYFYLTKGKHQLKMEVVLGDLSEVLMRMENSLYELNTIYRRIIMITSTVPDPMRSYQIEKKIPEIVDEIAVQQKELEEISNEIESRTGQKGGQLVVLNNFARLLGNMHKDPELIPSVLGEYRDNIGALGSWIMETRNQPLQIDFIVIASPDKKMPRAGATAGQTLKHEAKSFMASFSHEYNKVGSINEENDKLMEEKKDKVLRVWIGSGRDQAQILKRLIEDEFTPVTGIPVQLELIPRMKQILVRASTTGTGPDVALGVLPQDPMNFAMRGSAVNLKKFDDFDEVSKRFKHSAFLSYSFRDGVYALPEKQSFPMLFYRKDILSELGLRIPKTWQDVYDMLPELQKNNMQFGLGSGLNGRGIGTFLTFLYQKNGHFYKPDGIETNLDSETAIKTFSQLTDLFTLYDQPLSFNRANRFRMGEMPLVIADYSMYNQLKIFAPELRGEWGFALIPGTVQPDGSVNHTVASSGRESSMRLAMLQGTTGTATVGPADILLKQASDKEEEGWEFLKWWTSTDIQVKFGQELESLLGPAARYPTANVEAMKQLPWSLNEREKLLKQWDYVEGVREVPGSYYVTRMFDWAFRAVVLEYKPVRETLINYDMQINEELNTKRKEFGLTNDMNELKDEWIEDFWDQFTQIDRPTN